MLWQHYIFRRGSGVHDLWDELFDNRPVDLLYITGQGFDYRARLTLEQFVENIRSNSHRLASAELLLIAPEQYILSQELTEQTRENTESIRAIFADFGQVTIESLEAVIEFEDDEATASQGLRHGVAAVLTHTLGKTDVILDVSSLPRVAYLSIMTGVLKHLIPDVNAENALVAKGVNFQVIVAEDASLDSKIQSEDPGESLVSIPGFNAVLEAVSFRDWPLVWFPVLGENRIGQFEKVSDLAHIQSSDEIVPVLPHPSLNPRRADNLLIEYKQQLFDSLHTPTSNILFAHESHPFEAYRQILGAMRRYVSSLKMLGGCRILVTPLGSKMMTVATGLSCFEMRTDSFEEYGVGIPYVNPKRYTASKSDLLETTPTLSVLLLTGEAYARPNLSSEPADVLSSSTEPQIGQTT